MDYVQKIGWQAIQKNEATLFSYLIQELKKIQNIHFVGNPDLKSGLVSFNIEKIAADDLNLILAKENICVRVGHHCAMPIHERFGLRTSLRLSLGLYNDKKDIDLFIHAFDKAIGFFK